jgi:integrase
MLFILQWAHGGYERELSSFKLAGIQPLRIHDLRHFAASTLTGAGVEDNIIGLLTGHKSRELRRYQHLREELKRRTAPLPGLSKPGRAKTPVLKYCEEVRWSFGRIASPGQ